MANGPGEKWNYNNGDAHLLSAIIAETTEYNTLDFAREFLFGPLGISKVEWPGDPQGIPSGASRLSLTPHAMAKFGYLYLEAATPTLWAEPQAVEHRDPGVGAHSNRWEH